MPRYYITPFANSGDKAPVPQTDPSGFVNYQSGFTVDYEKKPGESGYKAIPRDESNQIYFDITESIQQYQQTGIYDFIEPIDNGGIPFPYSYNSLCRYNDGSGVKIYQSLTNNNISLPTDSAKWQKVPLFISGTAAGSANAITLNVVENYQDLSSFDKVTIIASVDNTGATTLRVGSGAVIDVNKVGQSGLEPLSGGEILNGISYDFEFNGSIWVLKNSTANNPVQYSQVTFLDASTQSLAASTFTKIQFNNVITDINALWDGINFRFVVATDGQYEFTSIISIKMNNAITTYANVHTELYKNGSGFRFCSGSAGLGGDVYIFNGVSGVVDAIAGDYFELFFYNGTGSAATASTFPTNHADKNLFEIRYLGQ